MTDALRLGQVYGRNLMGGEEDAIMAVAVARSYCDALPSEGFRDFPRSAFEQNVVLGGGYRAHDLMLAVFDVRQVVRHCARTWTIALGRHGKVQGLVRPLKVVDLAPGIERALYLVEFVKAFECKHLIGQCAMKALVLASALRVIWPAVDEFDAKLQEPNAKPGPVPTRGIAPWAAIIDKYRIGQTVPFERGLQMTLNRGFLLVSAGLETRHVARMIVDDGQGMATFSIPKPYPAFEVHLPQKVGR